MNMYLETTCQDISLQQWNALMKGARKCSYKRLVNKIKKEIPSLYERLMLDIYNPYCDQCKQTKTHYILVWSFTEYFIRK